MGNPYYFFCKTCKVFFYLGKETEFYSDEKLMYCFKDFLLSHCDHDLTVGGEAWNCASSVIYEPKPYTWDFREKGWAQYDCSYSEQDYDDEHKQTAHQNSPKDTHAL